MYDIHKAQVREHQDKGKDKRTKNAGDMRGLKTLYDMSDNIK